MSEVQGDSWQRRIGDGEKDLWTYLAQPRVWLTIKDGEPVPPTQITEGDIPVVTPADAEETKCKFSKLSPLRKYNLISCEAKVHSAKYFKDSMDIHLMAEDAEKLLNMRGIGGFDLNIQKHRFMNSVRGVIKSDTLGEMTEEEIVEGLTSFKCIEAKHLNKPLRDREGKFIRTEDKLKWVPSGRVIISLEAEVLPPRVFIVGMSLRVDQYEPDPMQCKCCFQFGHTFKHCPNQAIRICSWCSQRYHTTPGEKCSKNPHCQRCEVDGLEADHPPNSKKCPIWRREKKISSIRESRKLPRWKAIELLDGQSNDYSHITRNIFVENPQPCVPTTSETDKLRNLLEASNQAWEQRFSALSNKLEQVLTLTMNIVSSKQQQVDDAEPSTSGMHFTPEVLQHLQELDINTHNTEMETDPSGTINIKDGDSRKTPHSRRGQAGRTKAHRARGPKVKIKEQFIKKSSTDVT